MFGKLRNSLARTRSSVFGRIVNILGAGEIDDDTWYDLEGLLIQADVGVETTTRIIERLQSRVTDEGVTRTDRLVEVLKSELRRLLPDPPLLTIDEPRLLTLVLIVGANGSGKTTTIGKLAKRYRERGRKVILSAADTFRAAAIDQLQIWGERADVPVIAGQPGAIPVPSSMIPSGLPGRAMRSHHRRYGRSPPYQVQSDERADKSPGRGSQERPWGSPRNAPCSRRTHRAERLGTGKAFQGGRRPDRGYPDQVGWDRQRGDGFCHLPRAWVAGPLCWHRRRN